MMDENDEQLAALVEELLKRQLTKAYEPAIEKLADSGAKWDQDEPTDLIALAIIGTLRPLLEAMMQVKDNPVIHPIVATVMLSQFASTIENIEKLDEIAERRDG